MSVAEFFGAVAAIVIAVLGQSYVLLNHLGGRIDKLGSDINQRLDRIDGQLTELRVTVAQHVADPHAHERVNH
jgi:hypothetical protein